MPSGQGLAEEAPGGILGNEDAGAGVLASLFESYAAACRTGAEVDAGSDAAFEVRHLSCRFQFPRNTPLLPCPCPLTARPSAQQVPLQANRLPPACLPA